MLDEQYDAIKTIPECDNLIEGAEKERMEAEAKRIAFALQLIRQKSGKTALKSDLSDAQSRLNTAQTDLTQSTEGSPEWKDAEARRRRADADVYALSLEAEESLESVSVKIGHGLEVVEAIISLKDAHIAKLKARKTALQNP